MPERDRVAAPPLRHISAPEANPVPRRPSPRARQIVDVARDLLEQEGAAGLTMRNLAGRLGIKAPSLYKWFPDKAAVEVELIADTLEGIAEAQEAVETREPGSLLALAMAYRTYALAHPHLYRLATERPLPRDFLPPDLENRASAPLLRAVDGDEHRARAAWAFAHGMVILEIYGRFPADADLDMAWRTGIAAYSPTAGPRPDRGSAPGA